MASALDSHDPPGPSGSAGVRPVMPDEADLRELPVLPGTSRELVGREPQRKHLYSEEEVNMERVLGRL